MRPHQTFTRVDRLRICRGRRENRVAKWVGLLALAGLLAIATLPSHSGRHADADSYGTARLQNGALPAGAAWHG